MVQEPNWKAQAEKAQKALATASQRNTELLERLSGLRVGLGAMMRRSYTAHVAGVEKALGGHLSDLPDSVLLGYLEAFSLMSSSGKVTTPNDLSEIVRALRDSGFPMEDDATAVDMAVAIRGGFKAAKYDNDRLRKNNRRNQGGAKNSGAHAIQRDLSWAEPQDGDGNPLDTEPTPPQKASSPAKRPAESNQRQQKKQPQKPQAKQPARTKPANQQKLPWDSSNQAPQNTPQAPAPQESPEKLEKFAALEAALLQPAPRFMRDVVAELGSAELAAEWEAKQRGAGNWSFIPPQNKHRQRGSLLVPREQLRASISGLGTTPWGRALAQNYKAGRLYEVAVVLAKLSDTILLTGFSKHTMELTYRAKDELRALIVGLEPGADPWLEVEEAVGRHLSSDTAAVQDVLVVTCPARSRPAVVATLTTAASSNSWHMSAPVRVQELEGWAADGGQGAEIIPAG